MKEKWEKKKLKEICEKGSSNIVLSKVENNVGNYPLFGASGFVKNIDFFHNDKPYIGIVKDGSGVGRVNVYPAYSSLVGTLQYIFPKDGCTIDYLAYCLKSMDLSKFVNGAAIPHIYFKDYGECSVPVPPLSVQERIVSELDTLSGIISKHKALQEEYDRLEQAIFYDMFGDPVTNEKGWEVKKLEDFFTIKGGKRIPKGMTYSEEKTSHPYLRATDMKNNTIMDDDIHYIDDEVFSKIKNYTVSAGDIYLTNVGVNLGMAGIIPKRYDGANLTENAVKLVAKEERFNAFFISFYLNSKSVQSYIESRKMSVGVPKLAIFRIENIPLITPPLPLQQSFADKISAIEQMKAKNKAAQEEAEMLFNERMAYYF